MPTTHKRPFQFGIRGLMLLTASIAVGCSIGCLKTSNWEDGLLTAAATWIVAGLIAQITDLWAAFRHTTGLTPEGRTGWWFAMIWRGVLASTLGGHFLLVGLLASGRLVLTGVEDGPWTGPFGHASVRSAIFAMALLLVFAGFDRRPAQMPRRWWRTAINALSAIAVIALLAVLSLDDLLVFDFVHIACAGMAMGMAHGPPETGATYSDARAIAFFNWALYAASLVLLDTFFLRKVMPSWKRGGWRTFYLIALGVSLALTAVHPVWLATRGLKEISPCCAEVFSLAPFNRWFFAIPLIVLFVTAGAWRMVVAHMKSTPDERWNWRRRPSLYLHEWRLVALFVAGAIVCLAAHRFLEAVHQAFGIVGFFQSTMQIARMLLEGSVIDPRCQLWFVVFCVAIYRTIFGFAKNSCAAPPELSLPLFTIVWMALLALVVMAAPIFAALGFGICLNWWRLPY